MNKYQEAFKSISDNQFQYGTDEQWELLQELVNKETPKKPIKDNYEGHIGKKCSRCGKQVWINEKYCCNCGQHLDWSEYDE